MYVPFWRVLMSSSLSASFSVTADSSCCEVWRDVASFPTWHQVQANTFHMLYMLSQSHIKWQTSSEILLHCFIICEWSLASPWTYSTCWHMHLWLVQMEAVASFLGDHVSCCFSIIVNTTWCVFTHRPVLAAHPSVVWFLRELWRFLCSLSAGCSAPSEGTHRNREWGLQILFLFLYGNHCNRVSILFFIITVFLDLYSKL